MFTVERTKALRDKFGLSQFDFAQVIGADVRSVVRWEAGASQPSGSAKEIMIALEIGISKESMRENLVKLVTDASAIGGLAVGGLTVGGLGFLLLTLFEAALNAKNPPSMKAKNASKKAHDRVRSPRDRGMGRGLRM